jgi:selenide, water dikinase
MDPKEKRKRVMSRSIKLGHCVCDPRQPCPCPLFKERNVCQCAGERLAPDKETSKVKLTDYVRSAGCASKISQKDLHRVLAMIPTVEDPRLLVGTATADDAGVFRLTPDVTIVQTVDVFTPGVDDPFLFGRIAACNSLSDVYAMGGTPLTALSVIGFPIYSLPHEVMAEILRGGMSVLEEAGAILLGGHSINDEEIKFGFAVTGVIREQDLMTNAGAQPGDTLVLTKPLGTGIVSLASQIDRASAESVAAIGTAMATLNRTAAEVMVAHGARACTDVTGFGLLGHLCQLVTESRVSAEIWCDQLPVFPGVWEYAEAGMYSGANERNAEYSAARSTIGDDVPEHVRAVLYDAQTSGGLLVSVPCEKANAMLEALHERGVTEAAIVGRVTDASEGHIHVKASRAENAGDAATTMERKMTDETDHSESCTEAETGTESAVERYSAYMGTVLQPGSVDVVAKELIAVALSIGVHCEPCTRAHIKKALGMGIGAAELDEVAAIAMGFGGCRAMVLWSKLKKELLS